MSIFQKRYEDFLMHYGVPGMRWAIENQRPRIILIKL